MGAGFSPRISQIRSSALRGRCGRRCRRAPGDLADTHLFGGGPEPVEIAADFVVPQRDLQAKGDHFGVNAVCASNLDRVFELERPAAQHLAQFLDAGDEQRRRFPDQQRLGGVDDVVGRQAVVQPARRFRFSGGGHALGHRGGERDHVVADFGFDFGYARGAHLGVGAQLRGRVGRHFARFGERVGGGQLHGQPLLVTVLFTPDAAHIRARVTLDHFSRRKLPIVCEVRRPPGG